MIFKFLKNVKKCNFHFSKTLNYTFHIRIIDYFFHIKIDFYFKFLMVSFIFHFHKKWKAKGSSVFVFHFHEGIEKQIT